MRLVKRVFSLILLLAFLSSLGCSSGEPDSSADTTGSGEDTTEKTADTEPIDVPAFEKREDQVYAADLFDSSETLNIAFMGGSLTSGGISYNKLMPNWPISSNTWTNNIITYFVKKYKSTKTVYALNAALPGTSSDFAAERFDAQVVPFEPDILFIEYAVNDWNFDSYNATAHCEYIIRRCLDLDKIPVIIFLYAPFPMEDDDYRFERYTNGIEAKKGLVEHYGLTGVDAWDYVRELYKADETELSFTDWLSNAGKGYYNRVSDTYVDVHPFSTGYALFPMLSSNNSTRISTRSLTGPLLPIYILRAVKST